MCSLTDMTSPLLLNWRTRETLEGAFTSSDNYSVFVFLEDDLFVSWEALLKWAQDSKILNRHGFRRSFFRFEINPKDGHAWTLDYIGEGSLKKLAFPDANNITRYYVQAEGFGGTYCGIFVATIDQLSRFISSEFWSCKSIFLEGKAGIDVCSLESRLINHIILHIF